MSTLRTNALEGVDAKNSITIVAGAGNVTTTNVQEGLAKCRIQVAMATDAINDSFNASSITDLATGRFTCSLTSSMNGIHYPVPMAGMDPANANSGSNRTVDGGSIDASSFYFRGSAYDNTAVDVPSTSCVTHGDLA